MRAQSVRWRIARRQVNQSSTYRLRWILIFFAILVLTFTGASATAAVLFVAQLPPADNFHIRYSFQDARIYDSQHHLLYDMPDLSKNGGRRIVEPLQPRHDVGNPCRGGVNRIPLVLQNATIATEDATFYSNPGFDLLSIARAAYQDWSKGRVVSGASTITQQLVRSNMLNDARTIGRKANEIALAYEISHRYSKRTLLWYYLNKVYYGNLAYGAQAAATTYFQERVCKLDVAQAALLAGLPESPSSLDPVLHPAAAMARMGTVLHLMLAHRDLRRRWQIAAALQEAEHWRFFSPSNRTRYPHFVQYAINQMQAMPALRDRLYSGVDVYTTLDPRLQDLAQQLVTKQIDSLVAQHVTDGALVSLDLRHPYYGWIRAMVGSAHSTGNASQVNMALRPRQPGSSMKPFNYIWAFTTHGVGPSTLVTDSPIVLPDPGNPLDGGWYAPIDYDHTFHGTVTVRQALANSLNVPAVKTEYFVTGIANVARTDYRFGMRSLYKDNPGLTCDVCYAVTLGGMPRGTRPLEETAAYGVFATGGRRVPPVAIWKVVQRSTGKVIYCSENCARGVRPDPALSKQQERVLDAAPAYEMTNILSDDSARCTPQVCEFGLGSALKLDRPAAAKTGTTNDWTDNWTVGYTPQIITGVWVGNADRTAMVNVNGITGAAPIWHDFMESAFGILRLPVLKFVQPPGVISTNRCQIAGSSATGSGASDIYVRLRGIPALPMCAIPGTGYTAPVCAQDENAPYSRPAPCVSSGTSRPAFPNGVYPRPPSYRSGTTPP
jgi:membrane peptidoglycan carboxypeptidase